MLTKSKEKTRRTIESVATDLFLTCGYETTTMDAVAEISRVSKATLYAHFQGKAALFERVVSTIGGEMPVDAFDIPFEDGARAILTRLASLLLESMISSHSTAVVRTVVGLAPRLPQFGEALYDHAIAVKRSLAAAVLHRMDAAGILRIEDVEWSADTFLSLLTGDFYLRRLLGLPDKEPLEQAVDKAVEIFIRAHEASSPQEEPSARPNCCEEAINFRPQNLGIPG